MAVDEADADAGDVWSPILFLPRVASCASAGVAFSLRTVAPVRRSRSRLRSIARAASGFDSTKTAEAAPRDSASSPIAPEPA